MTGVRDAITSAEVGVPVDEVFAFLADLRNHWRLAGRWIDVVALRPAEGRADGATVRLRGPLGMVFSVDTRVDERHAPTRIGGRGACGRSRAIVVWDLAPAGPGRTRVSVAVRLVRAAPHHRLIWTAGGRAWLGRRLGQTVGGLGADLQAHAIAPRVAPLAVPSA